MTYFSLSGLGNRRLHFSQLMQETAKAFARIEEMDVYERRLLINRYNELFGELSLRLFSKVLEESEADLLRRTATRARGETPARRSEIYGCMQSKVSSYRQLLENRTEELLVYRGLEVPSPSEVKTLTDRLEQVYLHCVLPEKNHEVAEALTEEAKHLYADGEIEGLDSLLAERRITPTAIKPDTEAAHGLIERLTQLHTEIENKLLAFPFSLCYKLYDEEWIASEKERILQEIRGKHE